MDSEPTVSPILAAMAIASVLLAALTLMSVELRGASPVRALLHDHAQKLMALVAGVATFASLYYSEIAKFTPCEFCWYQRIAMYPLFVLLAVAVVTRAWLPSRYIVTIALIGLSLSVYHYQLQLFPDQAGVCSGPVSCTGQYVEEFGFVSIPFMAGCGFLAILLLQAATWRVEYIFRQWDEA